jgi:4-hydroxy-tetrahydrodipicolinate synthase
VFNRHTQMKDQRFIGTGVAVITPFTSSEEIDDKALEQIINKLIYGGVEYLVMLGTTAESVTLSHEEKLKIIDIAKETIDGRVPMILGIGGNNTRELLDFIKETDFSGINAILSVSPFYNKPTQEGIIHHYSAIADASPVPVLLYNVPARTSSNINAETTLKLAAHKNIIGIKEASGNMEQCMRIIKDKPEDFLVISGDDNMTLPFLSIGMDGVISVIANAYPKEFSDMVRYGLKGNFEEARNIHYNLFNIVQLIFSEGNPGGVKALMEIKGLCKNVLRLPLYPISNSLYQKIKDSI